MNPSCSLSLPASGFCVSVTGGEERQTVSNLHPPYFHRFLSPAASQRACWRFRDGVGEKGKPAALGMVIGVWPRPRFSAGTGSRVGLPSSSNTLIRKLLPLAPPLVVSKNRSRHAAPKVFDQMPMGVS